MISKENKIFRKMFTVTEYAALTKGLFGTYIDQILLSIRQKRNLQANTSKPAYEFLVINVFGRKLMTDLTREEDDLTLKAPKTTKVVCFSRLLKCKDASMANSVNSYRSSLFCVHTFCLYT